MAGDNDIGFAGSWDGGVYCRGDGDGLIKKPGQQHYGESDHQCFHTPVSFDGRAFGAVARPAAVFYEHINHEKNDEEEDARGGYIELIKKAVYVVGLDGLRVLHSLQEHNI